MRSSRRALKSFPSRLLEAGKERASIPVRDVSAKTGTLPELKFLKIVDENRWAAAGVFIVPEVTDVR
jgi:hypothetical protein